MNQIPTCSILDQSDFFKVLMIYLGVTNQERD